MMTPEWSSYPGDISEGQQRLKNCIPPRFRKWLEGLRKPETLREDWEAVFSKDIRKDQVVRRLAMCQERGQVKLKPGDTISEDWVLHNSWVKTGEVYTAYLMALLDMEMPGASTQDICLEMRYLLREAQREYY